MLDSEWFPELASLWSLDHEPIKSEIIARNVAITPDHEVIMAIAAPQEPLFSGEG